MAITKLQPNAIPTNTDFTITLADGSVVTNDIADLAVTHAKLHTNMDLTSKTVTLPALNQNVSITADGNHLSLSRAGFDDMMIGTGTGNGRNGIHISNSTDGTAPFSIDENAPNASIVVDNWGDLGIGAPPSGDYHLEIAADWNYDGIKINGENTVRFVVEPSNGWGWSVAPSHFQWDRDQFQVVYNGGAIQEVDSNGGSIDKSTWQNNIGSGLINNTIRLKGHNMGIGVDPDVTNKLSVSGQTYFNGNVGIGTTTPDEALDIEKSGANLRLYNNTGVGTSIIMLDTIYQGGIGMDSGNLYFRTGGQNNRWMINTSGDFIPSANDSYDIGSITSVVRNIYTGDLHLSNEAKTEGNEVDGTKGNWTIQEGEEHLYIINNKSGKKYRFALEEIQ